MPWQKHPAIATEIAVAGVSNGWVEMFHIGNNNVIYRKAPSAGINTWQAMPGTWATKVAATMGASGRVWVAFVGRGGKIYLNSQSTPGGSFGRYWTEAGGVLNRGVAKDVAIAKGPGGRSGAEVEVLHVGTDNHIYRWGFNKVIPTWERITPLGGSAKRVAAAKMAGAGIAVAHIGRDNAIYVARQANPGGPFGGWQRYGAVARDLAISGVGYGGFELYHAGTDNAIYRLAPGMGVTRWQKFAGTFARRIATSANRAGCVELAHIGSDGAIYRTYQTR